MSDNARQDIVVTVFNSIARHSARKGVLEYYARPTERVTGKPVDQIRHVRFAVGPTRHVTVDLSIVETVHVFALLASTLENEAGDCESNYRLKVEATDPFIRDQLSEIDLDEPPE